MMQTEKHPTEQAAPVSAPAICPACGAFSYASDLYCACCGMRLCSCNGEPSHDCGRQLYEKQLYDKQLEGNRDREW